MTPSCKTCKFYVSRDDQSGECHRFPPFASYHLIAQWPQLPAWKALEHWCGEWQWDLKSDESNRGDESEETP